MNKSWKSLHLVTPFKTIRSLNIFQTVVHNCVRQTSPDNEGRCDGPNSRTA